MNVSEELYAAKPLPRSHFLVVSRAGDGNCETARCVVCSFQIALYLQVRHWVLNQVI